MPFSIDHQLNIRSDGTHGILLHQNQKDVLANQIVQWFQTPKGSLHYAPEWGHELERHKHQPISESLFLEIEMSIFEKIENDIPTLLIQNLLVVESQNEVDLVKIQIDYFYGQVGTMF